MNMNVLSKYEQNLNGYKCIWMSYIYSNSGVSIGSNLEVKCLGCSVAVRLPSRLALSVMEYCTLAGLAVLSGSEAHLTLAAVTTRRVQTLAVLTQVHVVRAFVHVWAGRSKRWDKHFKTQLPTFLNDECFMLAMSKIGKGEG